MFNPDLTDIWNRFKSTTCVEFQALSEMPNGWNGKGAGAVKVENPDRHVLIFNEQGEWVSPDGQKFTFRNRYRWTIMSSGLRLEHLRRGIHNPVLLVVLQVTGGNKWESLKPHICGNDLYHGMLTIHDETIELNWSVRGPKKREHLSNVYT